MEGPGKSVARRLVGGALAAVIAATVGCTDAGPSKSDAPPSEVVAPLDPVCPAPSPATFPIGTSGVGPPGMGSGQPPVPPPFVPPEGLEDLARLTGQLPVAERAPAGAEGVIYLGTKGVDTIDGFMDRVVDNAEFFWQRLLSDGGVICDVELVGRLWITDDTFDAGPCDRPIVASRPAYYCGTAGPDGTSGTIVVGNQWMYDAIYRRFGDHADFAVASVLAHEMGHHVQDVLGLLRDTRPSRCCGLTSLNIELHADCLAGVWAGSLHGRGEIDLATMAEATRLAQDEGDQLPADHAGTGAHGTGDERRQWFTTGFESGDVGACQAALDIAA